MTDALPYTLQANFKFGPQYKETLVNVPAQSPEEMLQKLAWLTENAAAFVAAHAALQGVPPELAGNVTSTQVTFDQPPAQQGPPPTQQNNGGWGAPQQQGPPQWSQPATAAPTCRHGEMEYKDFTSKAGNHVKGHFCRSQNRQDQCPPVYPPKGR